MKLAASACLLIGATFSDSSLAGQIINVTIAPGFTPAKGDAEWGLTGCSITALSTNVTCPTPGTFTTTGTIEFVADDMGSVGVSTLERIPFVTPATAVNSGGTTTLTLMAAPPFGNTILGVTTQVLHVNGMDVIGTGGSLYSFGSTQTLSCATMACLSSRNGRVDAQGVHQSWTSSQARWRLPQQLGRAPQVQAAL